MLEKLAPFPKETSKETSKTKTREVPKIVTTNVEEEAKDETKDEVKYDDLPQLIRNKLEISKPETPLSRLNRRISSFSLTHSVFPISIRERFRIREVLGSGAYAQVWRVINRDTEEEFAMKVVFKNKTLNQKRLALEVEALTRAKHPNICCLREFSSDDNHLYLLQDLAKGGCLFDALIDSGGFDEKTCAIIMKRLLEAVAYLHEIGIVHRDIKLENVLLGEKDDLSTTKLSDFGVVRILEETDKNSGSESVRGKKFRPVMNSHVGSIYYMAPEFFLGQKYDESIDIWACGVLLFTILSMSSPFGNEDNDPLEEANQIQRIVNCQYTFHYQVWTTRSQECKDLISSLLKLKPEDRLSAKEALEHPWFKLFEL